MTVAPPAPVAAPAAPAAADPAATPADAAGPVSLSAPAHLDLETVHEFRLKVLAALDRAGAVQVDLSTVTEFDAVGGAVLIGCLRHARAAGRTLSLLAMSESAARGLQRTGLARCLPAAAPAAGSTPALAAVSVRAAAPARPPAAAIACLAR